MRPIDGLEFRFSGELLQWRGPAPYYFVPVPDDASARIRDVSAAVTYGWGVIPVTARIGATTFTTSLYPRHGRYLLPVKATVRTSERLVEGEIVSLHLVVGR
jgi:hypothetical protein